ncbi:hypothetical protein [Halodesulfurarchaeum sp.]|uniref:hypothetical protein n=1 Tax=Halodesulfurarchaeum sp. TaxID=1980530 RepID=UPI002FC34AF2
MDEWTRGFALLLVLLSVAVVLGPLASAASAPTIAVSVNGDSVLDGDRIVVPGGNLSVDVTGNETITSVVIRVDDQDLIDTAPNATTYSTTLDDVLTARWNTVQVIVKDEAGDLTTHQISVYKDTLRPDIGLKSPFEVDPGYQFPTVKTYSKADMEVSGTVEDRSNITAFSATVIGGGRSVETTTLSDDRFSMNTTLVPGNNSVVLSATDEYGHRTYRSTRIEVTDEDEPTLSITDWPEITESETVTPTVRAIDAVAVRSVMYRIPGQPENRLVEPTSKLLDAGRTNITRTPVLEFHRPGTYNVTFNVTDYAGQWTEETKTIQYDPVTAAEQVTPDIRVNEARSGLLNDSRYRLNATVANGSVTTVFVESEHRWDGIHFHETMYDGTNVSEYSIEENVGIESGQNELTIEVTDAMGNLHVHHFAVNTTNASTYVPPTTENPATTEQDESSQDTATEPTTAGVTRISVTEQTPLSPNTETKASLSSLLSILAIASGGVLALTRRKT